MTPKTHSAETSPGWIQARLNTLLHYDGPIILLDEGGWGAPYLINALKQTETTLIWIELIAGDQDDPIAQGNKLAGAIAKALGNPLFGYGMPFDYGLKILKSGQHLLEPLTFALSGANYGVTLAKRLLDLHREQSRVILHFETPHPGFDLPKSTCVLGSDYLKLTQAEARLLTADRLPQDCVIALLEACGGAFERFLTALATRFDVPQPVHLGASGPGLASTFGNNYQPESLLQFLLEQNRFTEALELTVQVLPHKAEALLKQAGVHFWAQGNYARLYKLLERLPEEARHNETVLLWHLASALEVGAEWELLPRVRSFLVEETAPELRATYAEAKRRLGDPETCLREAGRAVRVKRSPLTLTRYGLALGTLKPEDGLSYLKEALRSAETEGEPYWAALAARALAARLTSLGHYRSAATYSEWALRLHDEQGLGQTGVRLGLLNEWAFARILLGQTVGLEAQLKQEIEGLSEVSLSTELLLQSTLGDLLLGEGKADEAVAAYEELWKKVKRREAYGAAANCYIRALIEVGAQERALLIAEQALCLTEDLPLIYRRRALLAQGLALSVTQPDQANGVLEAALPKFKAPLLAPQLAQAGLYLTRIHLLTGDEAAAKHSLERAKPSLAEVGDGGLRFLAGPEEDFYGTLAMLRGEAAPLVLRFLGDAKAHYKGEVVLLRRRFVELLAVLAMHPEGMSGEKLALAVYGETTDPGICKVELSHLRKLIPIVSKPYRIGVTVWADFLEVLKLLAAGRIREAVTLYQAPLLPRSEAPAIVEQREFVEAALREAALSSADVEVLITVANRLEDDLTVWEAVLTALPKCDPRCATVAARVKQLRKVWGI